MLPDQVEEALETVKGDPALLQRAKSDLLLSCPTDEVRQAIERWEAANPGALSRQPAQPKQEDEIDKA